ncbi:MAG TPA: HAD family hydrolase [Nitrosospira sp.]|nr:HAD family hydrolase [Nitrosospira sp.]
MALEAMKHPGLDKAVFIDKDGTLIPDVPYNVDPQHVRLTVGAGTALQRLRAEGYKLIVISNQSGIARGLFEEQDLMPVNLRIQALLAPYRVKIDAFYYCPHSPADYCECRKPKPGMILQAARDHGIDLEISWMIGDILNDVEAGNRAGCRTIHLNNGNETEWHEGNHRRPLHTVDDWLEAASIVCPTLAHVGQLKALFVATS